MPTAFPAGLDVFVNPSPGVPQNNPSHSQLHTTANDALAALEAKVGVNSSAVASSLDYKISHLTHGDVTDFATAVQALANVGSVFGRTGAGRRQRGRLHRRANYQRRLHGWKLR